VPYDAGDTSSSDSTSTSPGTSAHTSSGGS
jgi:hypothetical protein